jgi:DNA polymerase I
VTLKNYGLITSIYELCEYVERINGNVFGYDIETGFDGPDREKGSVHPETAKLVGISFTDSTDWARYVPLGHDDADNLDNHAAARIFWDLLNTGLGVAHNASFELRHLAKWFRLHLSDDPEVGQAVRDSHGYYPIYSDTLVEAYLVAEHERFGLKPLTKALFGHVMTELHELFPEDLAKNKHKYMRFNVLPLEPRVIAYACEDSVWCLAIHQTYYPRVRDRLLYKVEKAIVADVTHRMEDEGICYDWALMRRKADELRAFRDKYNAEIMTELSALAGQPVAINLASAPQVGKVLFEQLGYRTNVYTDKTRDLPPEQRRMSTGKIALERLAQQHPVVEKIRNWKKITRLLGTYLDKYETVYNYADDGRAHPSHLSCFVITGRFAHADPPYAGSPRKYHFDTVEAAAAHAAGEQPVSGTCFQFNFRDSIIAPPEHYILGFDLSQAELRAIAGEAQEHALLEAFANGEDVHRLTASLMLSVLLEDVSKDQRDMGKMLNFAMLYGLSVKGLADRLGISHDEAQSLMDKYFAGMPAIAAYMDKQIRHGQEHSYVLSKFGRILPIWEYHSDNPKIRSKGDRACVNYPIQGAATGDYMKIAMVRAVAAIKKAGLLDKIKLVMNIHDALEFYVHRSVTPEQAIAVLREAVIFEVSGWPPMQADWHVARRWGSPTEIEVAADGTVTTKNAVLKEIAPAIEEDEDGELVEMLPEVDPEVVREAAQNAIGRTLLMLLHVMPTQDAWAQFMTKVQALPGSNQIRVLAPEGELTLAFTTGLTPAHRTQVAALLGDPRLELEYVTAAVDQLAGFSV